MSVDSAPIRSTLRGAVTTLPEEIDATNSEQVHATLTEAVRAAPAVLVADMTRTTFCSTAGVRALIMTHQAAEQAHTVLRIAGVHKTVGRIFALLGVDTFFNVYPSVEAALSLTAAKPGENGTKAVQLARLSGPTHGGKSGLNPCPARL